MPSHHRSGSEQSHSSTHDYDVPGASERMIHPLAGRVLRSNIPRGVQPQPSFLCLFRRNLQPLSPPQPLDTPIADRPAGIPEKYSAPTVAISTVLACQLDHVGNQSVFISSPLWDTPLRRAVLPQYLARPPFRDVESGTHMLDAGTATSGAQKFPFAASVRISLSSVRSDTARLSRSFSFCSRFSSFN